MPGEGDNGVGLVNLEIFTLSYGCVPFQQVGREVKRVHRQDKRVQPRCRPLANFENTSTNFTGCLLRLHYCYHCNQGQGGRPWETNNSTTTITKHLPIHKPLQGSCLYKWNRRPTRANLLLFHTRRKTRYRDTYTNTTSHQSPPCHHRRQSQHTTTQGFTSGSPPTTLRRPTRKQRSLSISHNATQAFSTHTIRSPISTQQFTMFQSLRFNSSTTRHTQVHTQDNTTTSIRTRSNTQASHRERMFNLPTMSSKRLRKPLHQKTGQDKMHGTNQCNHHNTRKQPTSHTRLSKEQGNRYHHQIRIQTNTTLRATSKHTKRLFRRINSHRHRSHQYKYFFTSSKQ